MNGLVTVGHRTSAVVGDFCPVDLEDSEFTVKIKMSRKVQMSTRTERSQVSVGQLLEFNP